MRRARFALFFLTATPTIVYSQTSAEQALGERFVREYQKQAGLYYEAHPEFADQQLDCQHRCGYTAPEVLRVLVMNYFFIGVAVPPGTVPSNFRISPFRPTAQPR
jgi:hypothetical protein